MRSRRALFAAAACIGLAVPLASSLLADRVSTTSDEAGVVRVKSALSFEDTITRLKADIQSKGIVFFQAIEQSRLAREAGISLAPSTLLTFGNPALGSHFITARAVAGLDWPVRLLVYQDRDGQVWAAYTDFDWIAKRHGIVDRPTEFAMASKVIASITSTITK